MPRFLVTGRITDFIDAESKEAAEAMVRTKVESQESDERFIELEEATDIDWSIQQMHKVKRAGRVGFTTYVREADEVVA